MKVDDVEYARRVALAERVLSRAIARVREREGVFRDASYGYEFGRDPVKEMFVQTRDAVMDAKHNFGEMHRTDLMPMCALPKPNDVYFMAEEVVVLALFLCYLLADCYKEVSL